MDKLGGRREPPKLQSTHNEKKKKKNNNNNNKPIKVVYISNPKRITTTPEEFKDCVQLYTGWNSDVARVFNFDGDFGTLPKDTSAAGPDATTPSASTGSDSTIFDSSNRNMEHVNIASDSVGDDGDDIFAGLHGLEDLVAL